MEQSVVYALDFDGVICDSAVETGMSGWKAACQIWDDVKPLLPPSEIIDQFRQVRPVMGTGYEAILLIRELFDGKSVESILQSYPATKQQLIVQSGLDIDALKTVFANTRDQWIETNLDDWVKHNPLFPGVAEKLRSLSQQGVWYIVTTKQERFVKKILLANHIQVPDERIYGLDRNKTKVETLIDLVKLHSQQTVCFVEDMLLALEKVMNSVELESVKLFLVAWGYNTNHDKLKARSEDILIIEMDEFLL